MDGGSRRLLLIDLENVVAPGQTCSRSWLTGVLDLARPFDHAFAAARHGVITRARSALVDCHVSFATVDGGRRNAADEALLSEARSWATRGWRDFVVVSGDRAFAALAALGTLTVIANPDSVSSALLSVAHQVFDCPEPPRDGLVVTSH